MSKSDVNGQQTNDIYRLLRLKSRLFNAEKGLVKEVPWNFTKFLVTADLSSVEYFNPRVEMNELEPRIVETLNNT